jgi:hypothetical protein
VQERTLQLWYGRHSQSTPDTGRELQKKEKEKTMKEVVSKITAPDIQTAIFTIEGTAPLVVHRFAHKAKQAMIDKVEEGTKPNKGKKVHEAADPDALYNAARYISREGWDGFNVAAVRCAMIRACSLVNFKMTIAKMGLFVEADGRDAQDPEYGLVRIQGKPRKLESVVRVPSTGASMVVFRPIYDEWKAEIRVRFDRSLLSIADVANLLARAGEQVGLCEGRPSSSNSAGMGWGTFRIVNEKQSRK